MRNLDSCRCWRCTLCPCKVRNKFPINFWNRTILLCIPCIFTMYFNPSTVVNYIIPLYISERPHRHQACVSSLLTAFLLFSAYSCSWYILVKIKVKIKIKIKILLGFNKIECCKLYVRHLVFIVYTAWNVLTVILVAYTSRTTHLLSDVFHLVTTLCCFWRCLRLTSIFRTVDSSIDMCIKMFSSVMSKRVVRGVHSCTGWNIA